jgi:hypothetical protein
MQGNRGNSDAGALIDSDRSQKFSEADWQLNFIRLDFRKDLRRVRDFLNLWVRRYQQVSKYDLGTQPCLATDHETRKFSVPSDFAENNAEAFQRNP